MATYADSFGLQWAAFRATQYDSRLGARARAIAFDMSAAARMTRERNAGEGELSVDAFPGGNGFVANPRREAQACAGS